MVMVLESVSLSPTYSKGRMNGENNERISDDKVENLLVLNIFVFINQDARTEFLIKTRYSGGSRLTFEPRFILKCK